MKQLKIVALALALMVAAKGFAQNKIVLKDGKTIENARYNAIHNMVLEYEQNGGLHDIELERIDWVEQADNAHWKPTVDGVLRKDTVITYSTKGENIPAGVANDTFAIDLNKNKYARAHNNSFTTLNTKDAYQQGFTDAKEQFHAPGSTLLGFVSAPFFFAIPIGTVGALLVNSYNIKSNNMPERCGKSGSPQYMNGFSKGMEVKKLNNTLAGAGIFGGTIVVLAAIVLGSYLSGH